MKVAKWGNSLAIRIPKDVAAHLELVEGTEVEIIPLESGLGLSCRMTKAEIMTRMKAMARPLPEDWKMSREEMNSR